MTAELESLLVEVQAQSDHNHAERRRLGDREAVMQAAHAEEMRQSQDTIRVRT